MRRRALLLRWRMGRGKPFKGGSSREGCASRYSRLIDLEQLSPSDMSSPSCLLITGSLARVV